jgi:hypothetical protein
LQEQGMPAETTQALLESDYAGQAHKKHLQPKASKAAKAEGALPQRQARHLAA